MIAGVLMGIGAAAGGCNVGMYNAIGNLSPLALPWVGLVQRHLWFVALVQGDGAHHLGFGSKTFEFRGADWIGIAGIGGLIGWPTTMVTLMATMQRPSIPCLVCCSWPLPSVMHATRSRCMIRVFVNLI